MRKVAISSVLMIPYSCLCIGLWCGGLVGPWFVVGGAVMVSIGLGVVICILLAQESELEGRTDMVRRTMRVNDDLLRLLQDARKKAPMRGPDGRYRKRA